MKRVVIIGAGIGGLATANLLAQQGYHVTVVERAQAPGGRAGQLQQNGFTFDTGPSWYLMPQVFEHYYSLLGTSVQTELQLIKLTPAYKVFFEHQPPITITGDITHDAATFEHIEQGAGSALKRYIERSDYIYSLSLQYFLYSNFTSIKTLLKMDIIKNGPRMLRLALQPIHRYVSSFVRDRRLRQILEYPMVFLGTSPFKAPALYSLMSALDFKEGVYYPKGGMYTIIESLVAIGQKLGVHYRYGSNVTQIIIHEGEATAVELADGTHIEADICISNADTHFTETQLLPREYRSYGASYWKRKEPSPSGLLISLGVRGSITEFEHHNLLFVDDWHGNFDKIYTSKRIPQPASLYICNPSKTDPEVAPAGTENLFILVPLPAGVMPDDQQTDELVTSYLQQIAAMTGVELGDKVITKHVFGPRDFASVFSAWQGTMLGQSHRLSQSAFFRTPNKSKKVRNLYYVGANTMPGIGLPMCLIGAELVSTRIAEDQS